MHQKLFIWMITLSLCLLVATLKLAGSFEDGVSNKHNGTRFTHPAVAEEAGPDGKPEPLEKKSGATDPEAKAPDVDEDDTPAAVGGGTNDCKHGVKPSEAGLFSAPAEAGRLLAFIMILGALGAQAQALLSLADYIGNKKFDPAWTVYYLKRPLVGAITALLMHAALNGGLLVQGAAIETTQGFWRTVAICLLAGLFSRQAMDKMGQVFGVLFDGGVHRDGALKDVAAGEPVLTGVEPGSLPHGQAASLKIKGTGFTATTVVLVNDAVKAATLVSATEMNVELSEQDVAAAGVMTVQAGKDEAAARLSGAQTLHIT